MCHLKTIRQEVPFLVDLTEATWIVLEMSG
jgi:hypothetical protein